MGIRDMELGECPHSSHVSQWTILYISVVWLSYVFLCMVCLSLVCLLTPSPLPFIPPSLALLSASLLPPHFPLFLTPSLSCLSPYSLLTSLAPPCSNNYGRFGEGQVFGGWLCTCNGWYSGGLWIPRWLPYRLLESNRDCQGSRHHLATTHPLFGHCIDRGCFIMLLCRTFVLYVLEFQVLFRLAHLASSARVKWSYSSSDDQQYLLYSESNITSNTLLCHLLAQLTLSLSIFVCHELGIRQQVKMTLKCFPKIQIAINYYFIILQNLLEKGSYSHRRMWGHATSWLLYPLIIHCHFINCSLSIILSASASLISYKINKKLLLCNMHSALRHR